MSYSIHPIGVLDIMFDSTSFPITATFCNVKDNALQRFERITTNALIIDSKNCFILHEQIRLYCNVQNVTWHIVAWPCIDTLNWSNTTLTCNCVTEQDIIKEFDLKPEFREVSEEHWQRLRHANRGRSLFRKVDPVPIGETKICFILKLFSAELALFSDLQFRSSFGTSILLIGCISWSYYASILHYITFNKHKATPNAHLPIDRQWNRICLWVALSKRNIFDFEENHLYFQWTPL